MTGTIQWVSICLCLRWGLACSAASSDLAEQKARGPADGGTVLLRTDATCGPNCLWQVAKAYGKERPLKEIAASAGTDSFRGTTVEGMLCACRQIGLPAEAVRTSLERLLADPRVAILLLNADNSAHYVILDGIREHQVRLLDGPELRDLPVDRMKEVWAGVAILIGEPPRRTATHLGGILQRIGLFIAFGGVACFAVLCAAGSRLRHSFVPDRRRYTAP